MSKGAVLIYAVALTLVALLVGCSGAENGFPTGTFTANNGEWVQTFDDDGSSTFLVNGTIGASSTFSIQANELTWETDSYCDARGAGKATYTWTFDDGILLFQVKGEDKCSDRLGVLDNVPYLKED